MLVSAVSEASRQMLESAVSSECIIERDSVHDGVVALILMLSNPFLTDTCRLSMMNSRSCSVFCSIYLVLGQSSIDDEEAAWT